MIRILAMLVLGAVLAACGDAHSSSRLQKDASDAGTDIDAHDAARIDTTCPLSDYDYGEACAGALECYLSAHGDCYIGGVGTIMVCTDGKWVAHGYGNCVDRPPDNNTDLDAGDDADGGAT